MSVRGLWLVVGWVLGAGALLSMAAAAQQSGEPPDPASGTPAPTGRPAAPAPAPPALRGEMFLSLQDALAMGIENNLAVEVVRHDPPIAEFEHTAAWGTFDPNLFGSFDYASDEIPVASDLQSGRLALVERETNGAAGLRGLIPKLGWSYDVAYAGRSLESTSSIQSLSPEYRANLTAQATLPLLRGFLWGEPWTQVKLTAIGSESALQEFRRQLMNIVGGVPRQQQLVFGIEQSYWQLAARQRDFEVAVKSLETARELLEQTEAQYEVGVVSRVEVVQAEAGVANREFQLIVAENQYRNAQDDLIDKILGSNLTPGTRLEIVPSDDPEDYRIFDLDVEESTRKAFAHRPELALARYAIEQREIQLKFAKNQRLPQLDLNASWGLQGLSGRTNPEEDFRGQRREPIDIPRGFWRADDDFFTGDQANSWSAGALLSIPIPNRTGRSGVRIAELELRKAATQLRRAEQDVILEVRESVRNLRSAREGIQASEKARIAAEEQLRAERIRLEHGESTPFDVLQREEDLVGAERDKITALQAYQNSVAALDRAQGTILRDRNIVVEDALRLR